MDVAEQRRMNRVSFKRWEQEIDRGYNFINTTNEVMLSHSLIHLLTHSLTHSLTHFSLIVTISCMCPRRLGPQLCGPKYTPIINKHPHRYRTKMTIEVVVKVQIASLTHSLIY